MEKIFVLFVLTILCLGIVNAGPVENIVADIGQNGLSFLEPDMNDIIQGVLCVAGAAGAITCVAQYLEGKIVGYLSGEIMQEIKDASPEAYNVITKYNEIKGYIDQGASILNKLKVNENGEITEGVLEFGDESSLKELFDDAIVEDILVSNAEYYFETKELKFKGGGTLTIKVEDEGEIQELIYENINEDGIFELNEDGLIESASFISTDESVYQFGDYDPIKVPINTKIEYKNGVLRVTGEGKSFSYGDLDISLMSEFVDFQEGKIICQDCSVGDIKLSGFGSDYSKYGVLSITDQGYLIENGEAIWNQNLLSVREEKGGVLITDLGEDLSDYDGNWILQTESRLEIQSSEDGMVDIEFLEEHDILNTDSKDVMSAVLMEGDGLEIEKRHEDGLIPRVVHRSSEKGRSKIIDDKMEFVFEDNEFVLIPPTSLEGDVSGKYQSVALELETDAPNINYKLRVNSYRQFAILSENDEELVTWNHNGLPVSALTEDNELQTLAQMREKYPGLEFEILPEKTVVGLFSILTNDYDEENFPPYLLYLTDVSLQSNPLLVEKLPELKFRYTEDSYLGVSQFESITIGREFVDFPELSSYNFSRGQRSPLQLLTHEYEHLFDINIKSLEQESFGWAGYVDESRDDSEIISFLRSLEDPELDSLIDDFYSSSRTSEKRGVAEQIENFYKSKYSSLMTLQQHYNQIVLHGIRNSIYNSDFVSSMSDILGNIDTTQFPEGVSGRTLHALEYVEEKLNDEDISAVDVYFSLNFLEKAIREEENLPKSVIPMDEIRQTVFRNTGLPAIYASYDPIDPGPFTMFKGDFVELQTTYREQTVEQRKVLAQSANPLVSNVYRRLTQLAFDSGKMPIEEFLEIMDEGFCERSDCLDKRCVEYKLLCCDRSPNSPNC